MGFRIVREPSADYIVKSGANYYAESDINLENILGTTTQDYTATLFNLIYGKIIIDNVIYLVSTKDMQIVGNIANYNSIQNIDDIISLRYAYGNQDGYVIGKGNEVNIEQVDTKSVLIKSGRFVVQGVEVDIDANGIPVDFDDVPQNSDVFVTVYAEVNLDTNSVNIQKVFDTVDYPVIDKGDDLTHITNGTANIEIAHVKISNGSISEIIKVINQIKYTSEMTVENSKKVNNLEIKKDENGVLRIGDIIIPQKKLLWQDSVNVAGNSDTRILSDTSIVNGRLIEVVFKDSNITYSKKFAISQPQSTTPLLQWETNFEFMYDIKVGDGDMIKKTIYFTLKKRTGNSGLFCRSDSIIYAHTNLVENTEYPMCTLIAIYEIIQ